MMENTWYTVISPESCSSILWRSWDKKEIAAEQLRLTATDMKGFGLVDEIVHEPLGGAHWDYADAANILKSYILKAIKETESKDPTQRMNDRIEKYGKMGFWKEEKDQSLA
jgi:acetyl-CoA carboxylase carboxyl transferase subunit alpha